MMPRWSFVGGSSSLSRNVRSLTCSSPTSRSLRKLISNGLLNSCPKSRLKPQSVNGLMYLPIVEYIVYIADIQRNFVPTKKSMLFLHLPNRGYSCPSCTNRAKFSHRFHRCAQIRRVWHPCHTHATTKLSSHRTLRSLTICGHL